MISWRDGQGVLGGSKRSERTLQSLKSVLNQRYASRLTSTRSCRINSQMALARGIGPASCLLFYNISLLAEHEMADCSNNYNWVKWGSREFGRNSFSAELYWAIIASDID